jgi:hypothetical protein
MNTFTVYMQTTTMSDTLAWPGKCAAETIGEANEIARAISRRGTVLCAEVENPSGTRVSRFRGGELVNVKSARPVFIKPGSQEDI